MIRRDAVIAAFADSRRGPSAPPRLPTCRASDGPDRRVTASGTT